MAQIAISVCYLVAKNLSLFCLYLGSVYKCMSWCYSNISSLLGIPPHSLADMVSPTLCTASLQKEDCRFSVEIVILCCANWAFFFFFQSKSNVKKSACADYSLPKLVSYFCLVSCDFRIFFSFKRIFISVQNLELSVNQ